MANAAEIFAFAGNPLDRTSDQRANPAWMRAALDDASSVFLPLFKGDPLIHGNAPAFLASAARREFSPAAFIAFLGCKNGVAHFAVDVTATASTTGAPFGELGAYVPLREAAQSLSAEELSIVGEARWLLDWHERHKFCAVCGAASEPRDGGAKRVCLSCSAEHFPRTDPVAIVLAIHEGACLLGRSPKFPPGFVSALAGFVEPCETAEECAVRELQEEAGVKLTDVRYQFSQPWPFPSSLMMGFIAEAADRNLKLDEKEIVDAHWFELAEIRAMVAGDRSSAFRLPPRFTIARRLVERWAAQT